MLEENDEHATDICYNHPTPQENKDCKPPKRRRKWAYNKQMIQTESPQFIYAYLTMSPPKTKATA
jgi:hypothetical protein